MKVLLVKLAIPVIVILLALTLLLMAMIYLSVKPFIQFVKGDIS